MTAPLLEIDHAHAGYGGHPVLHDISLAIPEGQLVTIIGPNGHGKTTFLRMISGLVPTSKGDIRFDGRSIRKKRVDQVVALGIVHIPQGDLIFSEMSVRDNLLMGAYLPAAYARVEEGLREVYALLPTLAVRQKQFSSTLSGGERRMLALGRGLMTGGRILLIDEPSLGLAPILIEQIYDLIVRLKKSGRTILLVEENASRVLEISDRIYLLDNGRFVWQGGADELALHEEILETYLGG
jgi:branched-chain amino acid transport system ATP-binding protein